MSSEKVVFQGAIPDHGCDSTWENYFRVIKWGMDPVVRVERRTKETWLIVEGDDRFRILALVGVIIGARIEARLDILISNLNR